MALRDAEVFGRGVAFPFGVGADGRIAYSGGAENIRQSIRLILLTEPGERVMLPEFGGGLKRLLFEPNTVTTHRLIEEAIVQALGRWEPRVQVSSVSVDPATDDQAAAVATIRYALVATRAEDQLRLRLQLVAQG